MVNNNNNGYYIPKEFKLNLPETATVSYYYPEEETTINPLIQDGAYRSEKLNEINPSYGPCDVCKKDVVTVEFKLGCPSCSNSEPSYWHHNKDGCRDTRMLITNRGYLSCGGCGTGYNMSYWRFSCSNHPGDPRSMNEDC
jgi:hypothetical protein